MNDCLFCKISRKEIPADVIFENEEYIVFRDVHPVAPVHVLLIPKKHIENMATLAQDSNLSAGAMKLIAQTAESLNLNSMGYRVVNNTGQHGGQTIFHVHFHIIGGRHLAWPPG